MELSLALRMPLSAAIVHNPSAELDLVARARGGDASAFEALVRRHQSGVVNLAHRIVGDLDAAHDVAQEALLAAYRQLGSFRGSSSFRTWLYSITVNAARGHLRSSLRRQERQNRWGLLNASQPDSGPGPADPGGPLVQLMRELPEKQRVALALFYLEELSIEEIARAARAPTGTVKAWLSRGRDRLRELAEERGLA